MQEGRGLTSFLCHRGATFLRRKTGDANGGPTQGITVKFRADQAMIEQIVSDIVDRSMNEGT